MRTDYFHTTARGLLLGLAMAGLAGCASAQSGAQRPTVVQADKPATGAEPVQPPAGTDAPRTAGGSTVDELQKLIGSRQVRELRTTYNGNYGASLLFKPDDLTYYVALFQQKNFWRVLKTDSEKEAEQTYRSFSIQTVELAEVDIRRIKLQAESERIEQQLASRSGDLNTLQNDLMVQRQQENLVAARQEQGRQEADQLADQQREARKQLQDLQRQIQSLEAQQRTAAQGQRATAPAEPQKIRKSGSAAGSSK